MRRAGSRARAARTRTTESSSDLRAGRDVRLAPRRSRPWRGGVRPGRRGTMLANWSRAQDPCEPSAEPNGENRAEATEVVYGPKVVHRQSLAPEGDTDRAPRSYRVGVRGAISVSACERP